MKRREKTSKSSTPAVFPKVARFSRWFHDPWGNKQANERGTICKTQYGVGATQLNDRAMGPGVRNMKGYWYTDKPSYFEYNNARFILSSYSVEKIRR